MPDDVAIKAAAQLYLYGYPLVYDLDETAKLFDGTTTVVSDPGPNRFSPARSLLGPEVKFVSPNNDTLYLNAACDVSGEPLVMQVPDTNDRYYVLQFVDAWSNNFAYVGRRATGTAAGEYLLAGPGYSGDVPTGMAVVEAPSTIFTIVGRLQVDGEADLPAVHALQDQFTLRPLSSVSGTAPVAGRGMPQPDSRVGKSLEWWERFRVALIAFPPPEGDAAFVAVAAKLGLTASASPFVDADPELAATLVAGEQQGKATLEELVKTTLKTVDGWSSAAHAFDYNLERLGLGTIDAPEWKIADRTLAYVTRAVAARAGLWGNHGYEARYDILWQDEHGDQLDGSRTYEVTLSPPPPVDAFWSLTMYDEPEYYLVANPIDRYSIGDRTPGLQYNDGGSVTIYLQHDAPDGDKVSNWLPAPAGTFRPILRSYQPQAPLLSGNYPLPKVRRTS
jgi:hypothetical protein